MLSEFVLESNPVCADIPHFLFSYVDCVVYVCQHNHFSLKIIFYCTYPIHSRYVEELKGTIYTEKYSYQLTFLSSYVSVYGVHCGWWSPFM
jgi:hypothetical protein